MEALACKNITVELSRRVILEDVSFEIEGGNVYALLGCNGAGKTTLLRTMSGLIKPKGGAVTIGGEDTASFSRKRFARNVCYLPQNHAAVFEYMAVDFVLMGRTAHGNVFYQPSKADRELALRILAETGAGHLAYRPYARLSSGEGQLVMLARALMQDTPFLLLDEPTSNLDFNHQRGIMDMAARLAHERGKAVLISIHDPNMALEYGDYIIAMRDKKVISQLCKRSQGFLGEAESVMRDIYDPSIKVTQIDGHIFVR